jgi:hypothetical protein
MKRAAGVVLGVLLVIAPIGVTRALADPGPTGLDRACSHETPQEKNKHCEDGQGGATGGGSGSDPASPPPPGDAAPIMAERAADCAQDAPGDGNPWPDGCDLADSDGDGVRNQFDNCPGQANEDQADADLDGIGDACDPHDTDGDGIADRDDNCPSKANHSQDDADGDGTGDACDGDQGNNGLPDVVDQAYSQGYEIVTAGAGTVVGLLPQP